MKAKIISLRNLMIAFTGIFILLSCESDDANPDEGTIEFTINGEDYSGSGVDAIHGEVTQRTIISTGCGDCPYGLQFIFFGGFSPRTLTCEGSIDGADLVRSDLTLNDLEFKPQTGADTCSMEITNHNADAKTFSATFTFELDVAGENYSGSGTLSNVPY